MYITIDPAKGGFQAHAWGDNNRLVWWTEIYTTKQSAQHAVDLLKTQAYSAPVYDRT